MPERLHGEHCDYCSHMRQVRDEYLAQRVDVWNTAAALVKSLGGDTPPDPEHVLALCEFLEGPE